MVIRGGESLPGPPSRRFHHLIEARQQLYEVTIIIIPVYRETESDPTGELITLSGAAVVASWWDKPEWNRMRNWVQVKTTLRDLVLEEIKERDLAGEKWGARGGYFLLF